MNRPKLALVKQDVYSDLYNCSRQLKGANVVLTSNKRTGPVGLFSVFDVANIIVETVDTPECSIWTQKDTHCRHLTVEQMRQLAKKEITQHDGKTSRQSDIAVDPSEIDWNSFDIVISYDIALPSTLCQAYPNVVWCYFVSESCMKEYELSYARPITGYDFFLNQMFRPDPLLAAANLADHVIEFPYFIQYYGCFHALLDRPLDAPRSGILVETHSQRCLEGTHYEALEKLGGVRQVRGLVSEVIDGLLSTSMFLRVGSHGIWGNSSIEAIAAGLLQISSMRGYKNRAFAMPAVDLPDIEFSDRQFAAAIDTIVAWNNGENPALVEALAEQRRRVNYLCFQRPLNDLIGKCAAIGKPLNLTNEDLDAVIPAVN
jgi:hypothetical protein